MATQLAVVNNILRRLREDTVTSVADNTYSVLIAQFVNDAKADLEDLNHEWSVYVTEDDHTLLADGSTREYDITATTDRSWLMRDPSDDQKPLVFDVTTGSVRQMQDIAYKTLLWARARNADGTQTTTWPYYFAVKTDSDGRGRTIEHLWALDSGDSARTIRAYWYIPQADLALDGTDDSTEIKLPARPIELRALFYALNERGEEMGTFGGVADKRAMDAIAAAVEIDNVQMKRIWELTITNNENV